MMLRGVALSLGVLLSGGLHCRAEVPCGIGAVTEVVAPVYPPIARAAHVSGIVVLLASFDTRGRATDVHAVSGPVMLKAPAETFVKGWSTTPYTGPRTCPVVVEYRLAGEVWCTEEEVRAAQLPKNARVDTQHFLVGGYALAICDPAADIVRRNRRFGIF